MLPRPGTRCVVLLAIFGWARDDDAVSRARRDGLALGLVGVYGVSFGAVAAGSGFEVWQACLLSLVGFTGGSQFAYVGVVASGGSAPAALASALLLGTRNTLYGLRLPALLPARRCGGRWPRIW